MLVRSLILNREIQQVNLSHNRWNEKLTKSLQDYGTVQLISKKSENKALRDAFLIEKSPIIFFSDFMIVMFTYI